MMMAGVGDKNVVSGIKIAMADEGPIPGRTPTRVPIKHPTSAQNRLTGASADPNPWIKRSQEKYMTASGKVVGPVRLTGPKTGWERQLQYANEYDLNY